MEIFIEIDGEWFFDCSCQFFLQRMNKLRYPAAPVIVVAIRDEDVVFEGGECRGHCSKIESNIQVSQYLHSLSRPVGTFMFVDVE